MSETINNQPINKSRRSSLKMIGLLPFVSYGLPSLFTAASAATSSTCTIAPSLTEGPYWVDEKLNRADITTDTTRASVLNGLPLNLTINVFNASGSSCGTEPQANIQVDIWHCDAAGEYSDASGNGQTNTKGQTFLRGYQVTDANGAVTFKTIYPGWYQGRAVHIHLRARAYDANGNVTYNFTTQLFFDDTVSDSVFTKSPYNTTRAREVRNSNDNIYKTGTAVMVALSTNPTGGYIGEVSIGLANLPTSPAAATFGVATVASGTSSNQTLMSTLTIASKDIGSTGSIFVAAQVANTWYFNNGQNWSAYPLDNVNNFPAFYTGTLSSSHKLSIFSGLDASGLKGTNIYVGYGQNALVMIQNTQYKRTYTL